MKCLLIVVCTVILTTATYFCVLLNANVTNNTVLIEKNSTNVTELYIKINDMLAYLKKQNFTIDQASPVKLASVKESVTWEDKIFGIMSVDRNGVIGSCTPGVSKIANIEEQDLVGTSISRFMDNEQWRVHRGYIEEFIKDNKSVLSMKREVFMFDKDVELSVHFIATEQIFIVHIKEL